MNGKKRKFKITYPKRSDPEIILSKALKSMKSQANYPLKDGYLKELQRYSLTIFDKVIEAMGKEVIEVLKEE